MVKKSHPGCSVAYVLDQDTQLETYEGLDVHRYCWDPPPLGLLIQCTLLRPYLLVAVPDGLLEGQVAYRHGYTIHL